MPPTSNMRKSNAATMVVTATNSTTNLPASVAGADSGTASRRTTSGRAIRTNTTRPANYYARPYGSISAASIANPSGLDMQDDVAPGFFPALQFFSDALTALPREVIRQFTLMKEVEAKIHGPGERLSDMVDVLMEEPVSSRKPVSGGNDDTKSGLEQGLLSLTASNSITGSANASVVNGFAPHPPTYSAQNSISGSIEGEEATRLENDGELTRRRRYHELRLLTRDTLSNLDEKNVVLAEANRVLSQQLLRIDSVMPHVDGEIIEDARLGSMTHWAYADNRQKKHAPAQPTNKRDVAATNSLAMAAHAVHENDIAQARKDAVREGARERQRGRNREHVDSDFDERPRKTNVKAAKNKGGASTSTPMGLGISTGEPVKRRKLDKAAMAPAMERSASAANKGAKGSAKETPRSTPAAEPGRKHSIKARPAPLQKKRGLTSANASPAMASSPLHPPPMAASTMEPAFGGRPQSARLRQNSLVTYPKNDKLADDNINRAGTVSGRYNGDKTNGKRKATDHPRRDDGEPEDVKKSTELGDELKEEDMDMVDRPQPKSGSNSGNAGQGSKTGTPRMEPFPEVPAMARTRSTRSQRGPNGEESSSEPPQGGIHRHRRNQSNSHLIKQLAPFNRSPDLDRHWRDDIDEDLDSVDNDRREAERAERAERLREGDDAERASSSRSPRKRRPISRRNTIQVLEASSPPPPAPEPEQQASPSPSPAPSLSPVPALSPPTGADEELSAPEEEEEAGDPDDPNEPKYCYCQRGSYGEMIACDNDDCPREWFHLECTGLTDTPGENEKWYCDECRALYEPEPGLGRVRAGRGRATSGRGR